MIVLTMTKDLTANLNAGEIIKEIVQSIGSGGGGPKHFGTAGFNKEAIYNNALELINKYLKDLLND